MSLALKYLKHSKQVLPYFSSLLFSNICMVLGLNVMFNQPNLLIEAFALSMICFFICLTFVLGYQFVKSESRMIGLFKLSGCSFSGILKYLGVQYLALTSVSVILSMIIGTGLTYLIYHTFSMFNIFLMLIFLNMMIIFYMLFVNLGEIYRHEIMDFIRNQDTIDVSSYTFKSLGFTIPYIASLLVYLIFIGMMIYSGNADTPVLIVLGIMTYRISINVIHSCYDGYIKRKMRKSRRLKKTIISSSHSYLILKSTIVTQVTMGISMLFYYLMRLIFENEPNILIFNYLMMMGLLIVFYNQFKKINNQLKEEYSLLMDEGMAPKKVNRLYSITLIKAYIISVVLTLLPIIVYMSRTEFHGLMLVLIILSYAFIFIKEKNSH